MLSVNISRQTLFLLLMLAFVAVVSVSGYAQAGAMKTASVTLHPNGPEAYSYAPPLTPEQHQKLLDGLLALRHRIAAFKPPLAIGPAENLSIPRTPETKAVDHSGGEAAPPPVNPGDFVLGSNQNYSPTGDGRSTVAAPSIGNSGAHWFGTMNWNRGFSNNGGGTWTTIADDAGPSDAPFFCCDQDAVHDHGRDLTVWEELFLDAGQTTGVIRLNVRNSTNTADSCTYDLDGGSGILYDYPHLAMGNNYIYITANVIDNGTWAGAQIWRYNLDQLAACQSITGNVLTWTGSVGQVVWVPARGVTDTMYLVTIENTSQNRYFSWPENSDVMSFNVVNVESSDFGAATCIGGTSNSNWMGDPLSTSSIGFQIRSTVAQDNGQQYIATYYTVNASGSGRPQAYAAGTIVATDNISSSGVLNFADIFSSTTCFGYPDVASNARGDIGLVIAFGSSSSGGTAAQGYAAISDDYTRGSTRGFFGTVFLTAEADDNPTAFGNYYTARTQEPADLAFIGATYGLYKDGINVRMSEFLRGRYYTGWLNRHKSGF